MMKGFVKMVAVFLAVTIFCSCVCDSQKINSLEKNRNLTAQNLYQDFINDQNLKQKAIKDYVNHLSLEEKLSQIFLINLESNRKFLPVEWFIVNGEKKTLMPAGYIFFSYNVSDNPLEIMEFTRDIKVHAFNQGTVPPFLCIDCEGGLVNRLKNAAGPLPENKRVSQCLTPDKAFELYDLFAKQFSLLGFDLNLAPVCEVESDDNKEFLDGRSYGQEEQVLKYASSCVKAFLNNRVSVVLKHFPGNSNTDPHFGLPVINMTPEIYNQTINVFQKLISYNPQMILLSHAVIPAYDKTPADLSSFWINEILINSMGYKGIILSDDIFMDALFANGYPPKKAVTKAVESGINCIMISQKTFSQEMNILKTICLEDNGFLQKIENSVCKMIEYKIAQNILSYAFDGFEYKIVNNFETVNADLNSDKLKLQEFLNIRQKSVEFYDQSF